MALMAGTAAPAHAFPFDFSPSPQPSISSYGETQRAPVRRAPKVASRPRHPVEAKPVEDLASKVNGPLEVIISLNKQELTLYSGEEVIGRSRVSTGIRGRATPTGVFSVIQKDRWHHSNLYDDAPMYFMQRITWSGVALHQGYVPNHPASHGCVRMPAAFAQQMWRLKSMGARVIIAQSNVAPVEITHPALFQPKAAPAVATITESDSLQAAERAWQIAMLDGANNTNAAATDVPTNLQLPPLPDTHPLKPGPVSVFISRKTGKLYVRKGFQPVFDVPVTIDQPDQPLGTHVFTAVSADDASARWTVVTMTPKSSAAEALDRITIPQEARDRISTLISAGASLIISDKGLGPETGKGTDFIVLNP